MKKLIAFGLVVVVVALAISCHKDGPSQPAFDLKVENSPSAKSADDAKASGVYKGTLVGSTGSFKLNIVADQIIGFLQVDDNQYILTTDSIQPTDLNSAIKNALFTDASSKVKLWFSVDADGSNPTVSALIEGHPDVQIVVMKETSGQAIRVYEGFLYTTDTQLFVQTKAAFNLVMGGDSAARIVYKVVEEYPVIPGAHHTPPSDWTGDAYYFIHHDPDAHVLVYYTDTLQSQQGPFVRYNYLLWGAVGNYTDNDITGKALRFVNQGTQEWDSVRLVRKL